MASDRRVEAAYTPGGAARVHDVDHHADRLVRRIAPWAVLSGAIVSIVVLFLLSLFGVGVGLATVDTAPGGDDTPGAAAFSIGAAIWGIITFLIALFAGGWISGRLAGDPNKLDGLLHGVVTWALATVIFMWLTATAVSSIIGGAFSLASTVASTTAQGTQAAASGESGDAIANAVQQAVPWQQIQQRIEQALPADVDVDRQTLIDAFRQFVTGGGDRQAVLDVLVNQGGMTQEEAESTLQNLQAEYDQAVQEVQQQAAQSAEAAAAAVSSAAFWSFVALLIGGLAAAGGGWLGTPRDELTTGAAVR